MAELLIIGTDHRLQQSIRRDDNEEWVPRTGGNRYRRLIVHCIEKLGAKAILEEAHERQESIAPTVASKITKERGLVWQSMGPGQPGLNDGLMHPATIAEAFRTGTKPEWLAGRYDLTTQHVREAFMHDAIAEAIWQHGCVLAVAGYVHLGVLARRFETEGVSVEALLFTDALSVDEARS